jgi:phosphoglycerate dehydrogenase-like enzyme
MKNTTVTALFIWEVREELKNYLKAGLEGVQELNLIFPLDTKEDNLIQLAKEANIIIGWRPTENLLLSAKNCKLFINPGAGVQHLISLFRNINKARKDNQIILVNGHGNAYFTAQHVVAMLLGFMNKVILHHNWMVEGKWRRGDKDAISIPLRDRKVGFIGYGHVNHQVHQFLSSFSRLEFHVLKRDWSKNPISLPTSIVKYSPNELAKFLKEIDILIVAVPFTTKTEGLIKAKELKLLKKESIVINVGRGGVIEEEAFFNVLKEKKIAGGAIDVWYNYQPDPDEEGRKYPFTHPFHTLDNVVLSPHRAASPFNDLERWNEVIENIKRFKNGRKDFLNEVSLHNEY